MDSLRLLTARYRGAAIWFMVFALCLKFVVPQGYMLSADGPLTLKVELCNEGLSQQSVTLVIPRDKAPQDQQHGDGQQKMDNVCAFSALAMPSLGGVDFDWLRAVYLQAKLQQNIFGERLVLRGATFLLPPSIGPPATF